MLCNRINLAASIDQHAFNYRKFLRHSFCLYAKHVSLNADSGNRNILLRNAAFTQSKNFSHWPWNGSLSDAANKAVHASFNDVIHSLKALHDHKQSAVPKLTSTDKDSSCNEVLLQDAVESFQKRAFQLLPRANALQLVSIFQKHEFQQACSPELHDAFLQMLCKKIPKCAPHVIAQCLIALSKEPFSAYIFLNESHLHASFIEAVVHMTANDCVQSFYACATLNFTNSKLFEVLSHHCLNHISSLESASIGVLSAALGKQFPANDKLLRAIVHRLPYVDTPFDLRTIASILDAFSRMASFYYEAVLATLAPSLVAMVEAAAASASFMDAPLAHALRILHSGLHCFCLHQGSVEAILHLWTTFAKQSPLPILLSSVEALATFETWTASTLPEGRCLHGVALQTASPWPSRLSHVPPSPPISHPPTPFVRPQGKNAQNVENPVGVCVSWADDAPPTSPSLGPSSALSPASPPSPPCFLRTRPASALATPLPPHPGGSPRVPPFVPPQGGKLSKAPWKPLFHQMEDTFHLRKILENTSPSRKNLWFLLVETLWERLRENPPLLGGVENVEATPAQTSFYPSHSSCPRFTEGTPFATEARASLLWNLAKGGGCAGDFLSWLFVPFHKEIVLDAASGFALLTVAKTLLHLKIFYTPLTSNLLKYIIKKEWQFLDNPSELEAISICFALCGCNYTPSLDAASAGNFEDLTALTFPSSVHTPPWCLADYASLSIRKKKKQKNLLPNNNVSPAMAPSPEEGKKPTPPPFPSVASLEAVTVSADLCRWYDAFLQKWEGGVAWCHQQANVLKKRSKTSIRRAAFAGIAMAHEAHFVTLSLILATPHLTQKRWIPAEPKAAANQKQQGGGFYRDVPPLEKGSETPLSAYLGGASRGSWNPPGGSTPPARLEGAAAWWYRGQAVERAVLKQGDEAGNVFSTPTPPFHLGNEGNVVSLAGWVLHVLGPKEQEALRQDLKRLPFMPLFTELHFLLQQNSLSTESLYRFGILTAYCHAMQPAAYKHMLKVAASLDEYSPLLEYMHRIVQTCSPFDKNKHSNFPQTPNLDPNWLPRRPWLLNHLWRSFVFGNFESSNVSMEAIRMNSLEKAHYQTEIDAQNKISEYTVVNISKSAEPMQGEPSVERATHNLINALRALQIDDSAYQKNMFEGIVHINLAFNAFAFAPSTDSLTANVCNQSHVIPNSSITLTNENLNEDDKRKNRFKLKDYSKQLQGEKQSNNYALISSDQAESSFQKKVAVLLRPRKKDVNVQFPEIHSPIGKAVLNTDLYHNEKNIFETINLIEEYILASRGWICLSMSAKLFDSLEKSRPNDSYAVEKGEKKQV